MSSTKSKKLPQYIASIAANIGAFEFGIHLGWSNVVQKEFEDGEYGFPCSKEEFSWISSTVVLGAMCMCIPTGYFINLIGRKWTMVVMCMPNLIGWILILMAQSPIWMYSARFVLGIACGAYSVAIPVYVGEIAQKEIRGFLGTLFELMICVGILYIWTIGAFLKSFEISLISSIFPVLMAILMLFMPESPTCLITKGDFEAADKSFAWLRGREYDSTSEIEAIKAVDAFDKAHPVRIFKAIKRPVTIREFIISSMLMVLAQMSGINVVVFYSADIFRATGVGLSPEICTLLLGIAQLLAIFIALFLMDILGRRSLLLISGTTNAICTFGLGLYFLLKNNDPALAESLSWLPLVSTCTFVVAFSVGYGPIPFVMLGEIFATDIKGIGSSTSATINWLFAFIVTKTFVNLKNLFGAGGTFMLFAGITVIGVFFIWFLVIETKGKSLNEIQEELNSMHKL